MPSASGFLHRGLPPSRRMRLHLMTLVALALWASSCGTSSQPEPGRYLFTASSRLLALTWNAPGGDGSISGSFRRLRFQESTLSAQSAPEVLMGTYTGKVQQADVAITLPGDDPLSGQITAQGTLQFLMPGANGATMAQEGVPLQPSEEETLEQAFIAHLHLRGALVTLHEDERIKPLDGISEADLRFQVNQASRYVDQLAERVASMQQTLSEQQRCQDARDWVQVYPPPSSEFDLYGPAGDTYLSDITHVQTLWQQASPLPPISLQKLAAPFLQHQASVHATLDPAQADVATFEHDHHADFASMNDLTQHAQALADHVDAIKKSC